MSPDLAKCSPEDTRLYSNFPERERQRKTKGKRLKRRDNDIQHIFLIGPWTRKGKATPGPNHKHNRMGLWAAGKCCTEAYILTGELWLILLTSAQVSRKRSVECAGEGKCACVHTMMEWMQPSWQPVSGVKRIPEFFALFWQFPMSSQLFQNKFFFKTTLISLIALLWAIC